MEIIKATDLRDALYLLNCGARPAAGYTNILVDRKKKGEPAFNYADISGLIGLRGIRETDGTIEIGALTTFAALEAWAKDKPALAVLYGAASEMGSPQVRNRATVGGNIADASPACDAGPALLVLDAVASVQSERGSRNIPISAFFRGVRETALEPGELICSVTVPEMPVHSAWRKVGLRSAMAISVVSLAACRFADGRLLLAMGSVAPRPVRLTHCEACLAAGNVAKAALLAALDADIAPITDLRAEADYRRKTAGNLLLDLLEKEFGYEII